MLLVTWMKSRTCSSLTPDVGLVSGFLHVDLTQVTVIISLCRNPDGLLWAGDTAQTISIGSTFTFKQLGASVYRYQVCIYTALSNTLFETSSRGQFERCAGALVNLRAFSCSKTTALMAVLSNVQTPSSSSFSDSQAPSISCDQRQESSAKNCPYFITAPIFPKDVISFFHRRKRARKLMARASADPHT
jgi:hypothetical protein